MVSLSRLRFFSGLVGVITAFVFGGYADLLVVRAFDRNGSAAGNASLFILGLALFGFSSVIFCVGIKWTRAGDSQA